MTGLHDALQTFWSGVTYGGSAIKAYEQGNVPGSAVMPYITYEVVEGAYWGATILTAFVWIKKTSGVDAQAVRSAILDAVALLIPTEGTALIYDGGAVRMYRNDAGFLSYYDDPADLSVLGGRVSYEMHFYNP